MLDNYKQALSLALQGGRQEDIQAQQQLVVQSQQALRNALANEGTVKVNRDAISAAQDAVTQAQGLLTDAQKQLANTNLVSPMDGVVSQRSADPGQTASPGNAVLVIVDLHTVYYQPTVSEGDFSDIAVGQPVSFQVNAYPGRSFHGQVSSVYPAASATNRQFSIRVTVPNPGQILRPGMYARGEIQTRLAKNVIVVPMSALVPRDMGTGIEANNSSTGIATGSTTLPPQQVYLVSGTKTAISQPVEIGIVNGAKAEVTQGLSPGDLLIVRGQGQIHNGDPVAPQTADASHGHQRAHPITPA